MIEEEEEQDGTTGPCAHLSFDPDDCWECYFEQREESRWDDDGGE